MAAIDITEDVLFDLGLTSTSSADSANVPPSIRWDCAIGSIPFLFAFSDQNPYIRETAEFRRQRIDTERNPGEQSLDSGMWIRSQSSWHYGSGLSSAEPLEVSDAEAQFRYHDGGGINPWTAGQLTLLNDTALVLNSSGVASGQQLLGVDTGVLHSASNKLYYITNAGVSASVNWGGSSEILSLTTNGQYWVLSDVDGIYKGNLPNGAGSKIYNSKTSNDRTLVRWIKSRLMFAASNSIYEITNLSPTSANLPAALYNHPSSDWIWTDFSEGPTAIYASGYDGDMSAIYKIGIDITSTTVTLAQPIVVAEMPRGESVTNMYSYVGTYLIIGTTKGVRVATMDTNGSLSMGPLIVESSDGCKDAVASESYVYVTVGSKGNAGDRVNRPGLYRIDLGTNLNNNPLVFASAADLVVPNGFTGKCDQVTISGGKLWLGVNGAGVFKQQDTYVQSGWIETGRIRLGTVESKAWRDLRLLSTDDSTGKIAGYASSNDNVAPSNWNQIIELTTGTNDSVGLLNSAFPTAVANLFAAFKLTRADNGASPVMIGYQVRAIPAPRRNQLVQVPIMCFDFEVDRQGVRYGQKNGAYNRMNILRLLEKNASTVIFRDYTTGESVEAYIERISYRRTNPPTRQVGGNGGIATVVLRILS